MYEKIKIHFNRDARGFASLHKPLIMVVYCGWPPSADAEGSEETDAGSDSWSIKKIWQFDYIHNVAVICISIQRNKLGDCEQTKKEPGVCV